MCVVTLGCFTPKPFELRPGAKTGKSSKIKSALNISVQFCPKMIANFRPKCLNLYPISDLHSSSKPHPPSLLSTLQLIRGSDLWVCNMLFQTKIYMSSLKYILSFTKIGRGSIFKKWETANPAKASSARQSYQAKPYPLSVPPWPNIFSERF